jgi:hypothetical protein
VGHGVEALARGWQYGAESVNDRFGAGRGLLVYNDQSMFWPRMYVI